MESALLHCPKSRPALDHIDNVYCWVVSRVMKGLYNVSKIIVWITAQLVIDHGLYCPEAGLKLTLKVVHRY